MTKRFRAPKAKPGELKAQWGKLPHDTPDMCYAWGDGAGKADARLLSNALGGKTYLPGIGLEPSLIDELKKRGYDLTTLRFSVQKKAL